MNKEYWILMFDGRLIKKDGYYNPRGFMKPMPTLEFWQHDYTLKDGVIGFESQARAESAAKIVATKYKESCYVLHSVSVAQVKPVPVEIVIMPKRQRGGQND